MICFFLLFIIFFCFSFLLFFFWENKKKKALIHLKPPFDLIRCKIFKVWVFFFYFFYFWGFQFQNGVLEYVIQKKNSSTEVEEYFFLQRMNEWKTLE
jgi:hypothetical protein